MNNKTIYNVNSVGDANCIYIAKIKCMNGSCAHPYDDIYPISFKNFPYCKRKSFLIDFGYQRKEHLTDKIKKQAFDADEFLLSHYHLDHYKGLGYIDDNSLSVEKLYYPYIPKMQKRYTLLRAMYFISCIDGGELIGLLWKKNYIKDFTYKPVFFGDKIFDGKYEVIWPPKYIPEEETMLRKIRSGIENIEKKLNEKPEIRELWEKFNRSFKIDAHTLLFKNDKNDSQGLIKGSKIDFEKYVETIDCVRTEIGKITNRFSVCLYKENEFLFLGDLEKEEVEVCVKRLYKRNNNHIVHVKYLITPHHGTVNHFYPNIGYYVRACWVVSSNGEKRFKDYEDKYNGIANQSHCTHINGDFIKILEY